MLIENELFANRYVLIKRLGQGSFSEVWKAEDTKVGGLFVALKIYAPDKGLDESDIHIFRDEFAIVYNLHHQNLLTPATFDEEKGSPFLVMQYCEQGSSCKLLGKMDERLAAQFLHDVSSALAYLHDSNIVHQDIKPDNILIDSRGNFLVTDFGISTKIRNTLRKATRNNNTAGTTAYMGPERFSKNPIPIKASDIWSLGATVYELINGDVPFGDMGGLFQKNGADLPEITGHYSFALKTLIERCLAEDPWNRPEASQISNICANYLSTGFWNLTSLINNRSKKTEIHPKFGNQKTHQTNILSDTTSLSEKKSTNQAIQNVPTNQKNKKYLTILVLGILLSIIVLTTLVIVKNTKVNTDTIYNEPSTEDTLKTNNSQSENNQLDSLNTHRITPSEGKIQSKKTETNQKQEEQSKTGESNNNDQPAVSTPRPDQSAMFKGRGGTGSGGGSGSGIGSGTGSGLGPSSGSGSGSGIGSGTGSGLGPGEGGGHGGGIGYGTGTRGMINTINTTINAEGQVCVEVHVTAEGNVISARVINTSKFKTTITNSQIQAQCIAQAKQARYKAGKEELRVIIFK